MTQEERNREIAVMLGWTRHNHASYFTWTRPEKPKDHFFESILQFDRDWNWLMEAVEFIEKIYNNQPVYFGHNNCVIFSPKTIRSKGKDKKEAVFIAVSDFAKLYNEGKL
jgi:hypothetical protein